MHLVCLGVVRRMLNYWKAGDRLIKQSSRHILEISDRLVKLRNNIPSDFVRRPRSLVELDRWKATEYRQFLLYTGPVVLKSILPSSVYVHFLSLSISMAILLKDGISADIELLTFAHKLLRYFVMNAENLYGESFVVFNVHNLLHLADDVKTFGCDLNSLSAFRFENYLHILKRLIRSSSNPLVQITKRIEEKHAFPCHSDNCERKGLKLSCKERDSCILLKNGKFATIVAVNASKLTCEVFKRKSMTPFFTEPCSSEIVKAYFVKRSPNSITVEELSRTDIQSKAIKMPHADGHVLIPLLHREEL